MGLSDNAFLHVWTFLVTGSNKQERGDFVDRVVQVGTWREDIEHAAATGDPLITRLIAELVAKRMER